ncbi:MAG: hypothetical protein K0Q70_800 [Rhodospirillales bacterium]|jgi:hypothetical protein|nr:hypothetical protein [Rhodospirillales bacterium]
MYLSWIIFGRNDGYGGNQRQCYDSFARHLGALDRRYPGTFELIVVDWNPPSPDKTMADGFDWSPIERVKFVSVSPEIHAELVKGEGTPFLNAMAVNVGLRAASGRFCAMTTQDIYLTPGIMSFIGERRLSPAYFYRADRCDFTPDFKSMTDPEAAMRIAYSNTFMVHRRPPTRGYTGSLEISKGQDWRGWPGTAPIDGEIVVENPTMILPADLDATLAHRGAQFRADVARGLVAPNRLFLILGLHTFGCGDFILAEKKAFEAVRGLKESVDPSHCDTLCLVQMWAQGYRQAIFALPEAAFHADHVRSADGRVKPLLTYAEHEQLWTDILSAQIPPLFNGENWGLTDYDLPVVEMKFGRRIN